MIRKIANASHPPHDAWLVVQRELAYRMCGLPFDQESIWSLRLKPWWHLEIADHLKRVEFDPPPAVESVFLHMQHRTRPLVASHHQARFIQLIENSFRSNKPISLALKPQFSKKQLRRISSELKFNPHDPPSRLMFEQWLGIFRNITRQHA